MSRTWRRAQAIFAERTHTNHRAAHHLTPLMRCHHCGGACRCDETEKRGGGITYHYYSCHAWKHTKDEGCRWTASEEAVEAVLWRQLELLVTGEDLQRAVDLAHQRRAEGRGRRGQITKRLGEIAAALERGVRLVQAGGATVEALAAANAPLVAEQAELDEGLRGIGEGRPEDAWGELAKRGPEVLATVRRRATMEDQLRLLWTLYERVEVTSEALTFRHRGALPPATRPIPRPWRIGMDTGDVGF